MMIKKKGQGSLATNAADLHGKEHFIDFCNERVKKVYKELGDFQPEWDKEGGLTDKSLSILEGSNAYEGSWSTGNDAPQGIGNMVWSDGSLYQGVWNNGQ